MKLWDFFGGLTLPARKSRSTAQAIQRMPLAERLTLTLAGTAIPLVAAGQRVLKGECLARDGSGLGADLHAPSSGQIESLSPSQLVLHCDGQEQWRERQPCPDWLSQDKATLHAKIRRAGLVGLGGAGFPTATKLATQQPIHTLIVNGAECEPYISCDDALMRERAAEVITGAQILTSLLGAERVLIAVEDDKPEALAALTQATVPDITIVAIPTRYPSGGQKQLVTLLSGEEVPSGEHPTALGFLVQNVATVAAVARAVCADEPLLSRIVTVTGEAVSRPGNYEVALGTPIAELLRFAGAEDPARVLLGGPLMGEELVDVQRPVTKTTNCLIVPTSEELPNSQEEQPCIRCGDCVPVCPAKLLPQQLFWFARSGELAEAEAHHLQDCIECGACAAVCPSAIPLVSYYRRAKSELRTQKQEQEAAHHARQRYEARGERLARQAAERAARPRVAVPVVEVPVAETPQITPAPALSALDKRKAEIAEAQARAKAKRAGAGIAPIVETPAPAAVETDLRKAEIAAARARAAARKSQLGKELPP